MSLVAYSWDQATMLGLATARGFGAVGINAATVRKWVSRGDVRAVGKAPGGAHLYVVADVVRRKDEGRGEWANYTLILFRRTNRPDAETLADPELVEAWRMHVLAEGGSPRTDPTVTITHGPPRRGLRVVTDGVPDSATIAIRITGKGTRGRHERIV